MVPSAELSKPGSDPSLPLSIKSATACGVPLCAVVSSGLLEAGGPEETSDGEFCEISSERVPVGKSSANKSEADLPKLPERRIGAPNGKRRRKMPSRGRGAASAAAYCDFVSLDAQFLIVFSIIFMQGNAREVAREAAVNSYEFSRTRYQLKGMV